MEQDVISFVFLQYITCNIMLKIVSVLLLAFFISQNSFASTISYPLISSSDSVIDGKIYHVKAVVKKKLAEQKKMIIKHERIKGLMEAMTMAFPVADTVIFDNCAVGSKGLFTLRIEKGFPVIIAAHFSKPPKYVCPMHPHELSNTKGACSICGMPLVKRK